MKQTCVLCLGNEYISDDGFGPRLAFELQQDSSLMAHADVMSASLAGFSLLPVLDGRKRVLVVDTIVTGEAEPGTLHFFPIGELTPSTNLVGSHQISLPTALELGLRLGQAMPERVDVLAVEAADLTTLQEALTPAVEAALPTALSRVAAWVTGSEESTELNEVVFPTRNPG